MLSASNVLAALLVACCASPPTPEQTPWVALAIGILVSRS